MPLALQLMAHGAPGRFEVRDVPAPVLAPDDVVVEVVACGLNHLDLWAEEAGLPVPVSLPRTLGGEAAGRIAALGAGVRGWKVGDAVAVQSNLFCGQCEYCQRGEESFCLQPVLLGVQRDGGFAEQVCVPERALARLPAGVSFETSASLTLAGSTAMHMLTKRASVRSGDWVLVMGAASGVGSAAIQIALQLGGRVIATASSPAKQWLGRELGAEHVLDSNQAGWPAEVRRLTGKRGADVVVEHIGGETLVKCFECLARGGTVVTCGATAGRDVQLSLWPLFVKQQRLVGSYSRDATDLRQTLDWAAAGKLRAVIHAIYPLARGAEAFADLRARRVLGKALIGVRAEAVPQSAPR